MYADAGFVYENRVLSSCCTEAKLSDFIHCGNELFSSLWEELRVHSEFTSPTFLYTSVSGDSTKLTSGDEKTIVWKSKGVCRHLW